MKRMHKKGKIFQLSHSFQHQGKRPQSVVSRNFFDRGNALSLDYDFTFFLEEENLPAKGLTEMIHMEGLGSGIEAFEDAIIEEEEEVKVPVNQANVSTAHEIRVQDAFEPENQTLFDGQVDDGLEHQISKPRFIHPIANQEPHSDEFEEDLAAILGGKKIYDSSSKELIQRDNSADHRIAKSDKTAQPKAETTKTVANPHAVFDRMSTKLNFANTFDLGTFDISQTFSEFDSAIEAAEQKKKKIEEKNNARIIELKGAIEETQAANFPEQNMSPEEIEADILKIHSGIGTKEKDKIDQIENRLLSNSKQSIVKAWSDTRKDILQIAQQEEKQWSNLDGSKKMETEPQVQPNLKKYWSAVLGNSASIESNIANHANWNTPFLCWVMTTAGVHADHGLIPHRKLFALMAKALKNVGDNTKKIQLKNWQDVAPSIGDIICTSKENDLDWAKLEAYQNNPNFDEVSDELYGYIAVDEVSIDGTRHLLTIGGNVGSYTQPDSTMTLGKAYLELDENGLLTNTFKIYEHDSNGQRTNDPPKEITTNLLGIIKVAH